MGMEYLQQLVREEEVVDQLEEGMEDGVEGRRFVKSVENCETDRLGDVHSSLVGQIRRLNKAPWRKSGG